MAIIKWDPWKDIEGLFDRYAKSPYWPQTRGQDLIATGDWTPRVDISETPEQFLIKMEIPEVNKEDVTITVDNGILMIRGERKKETEEKGKKYHRIERHYGSFTRSFTLPDNIDTSGITASFKEGMLNVQVQKTEEKKTTAQHISIE